MSAEMERLEQASRRALAHRARLKAGTEAIKARLAPGRLIGDGKLHVAAQAKSVMADGQARVRAHPVVTAAVVTGLLGWVFRKPLLRYAPPVAQRGYDWLAGKLSFSEIGAQAEEPDGETGDVEAVVEGENGPLPDPDAEPETDTRY